MSARRWWKKPRKIVVGGTAYHWSLLDHSRYRELRVYQEKQLAVCLRLTYPEAWGIDLFRPGTVAYIIGWYEGGGRRAPVPLSLSREPVLLRGLLDLFFLPEEREQRERFLARIETPSRRSVRGDDNQSAIS